MHHLPPPRISPKHHPVHILVKEAYDSQSTIGWDHAIRGRLSTKWLEAQSLHAQMRSDVFPTQRAILVRIIWKAMDDLWKAQNEMEHGTTEEDRSKNRTARINEKIKAAYKKIKQVSLAARSQLFTIPRTRRIK